jgi:hypothetical protein
MIHQLVSGDALSERLSAIPIVGEIIVCREALVDGPIDFPDLNSFWNARAAFVELAYDAPKNSYRESVRDELAKLAAIDGSDEVNLWFGDDLFCQVNLWFCLSLLKSNNCAVYRVFPDGIDFGAESDDGLLKASANRLRMRESDRSTACELWDAFRSRDHQRLLDLSRIESSAFRRFDETILAAVEIDVRPQRTIRELQNVFGDDFESIFREFSRREAIYGFGDSQVRARL